MLPPGNAYSVRRLSGSENHSRKAEDHAERRLFRILRFLIASLYSYRPGRLLMSMRPGTA
jgi:hypothetical protein